LIFKKTKERAVQGGGGVKPRLALAREESAADAREVVATCRLPRKKQAVVNGSVRHKEEGRMVSIKNVKEEF
jgi:hypothetical protein